MKLAVLSDTWLPTSISYPGHGLGRSVWRIAAGLAARGHDVTLYGGRGSHAPDGCKLVEDGNEDQRAYTLAGNPLRYDAILDGTHHYRLGHLRPQWPVVCKVADNLGDPPRNRVYGNKVIPLFFDLLPGGKVIPEGIDVDHIPFVPFGRNNHLLFASLIIAWKKPDVAAEIADKANLPLWFMGTVINDLPMAKHLPSATGLAFYGELAKARGVIYPVSSMALMEAAATGTPGISMLPGDDWVAEGITGFVRDSIDGAVDAVGHLADLDPKQMRAWVADHRGLHQMAKQWEGALESVANGERWQ